MVLSGNSPVVRRSSTQSRRAYRQEHHTGSKAPEGCRRGRGIRGSKRLVSASYQPLNRVRPARTRAASGHLWISMFPRNQLNDEFACADSMPPMRFSLNAGHAPMHAPMHGSRRLTVLVGACQNRRKGQVHTNRGGCLPSAQKDEYWHSRKHHDFPCFRAPLETLNYHFISS